MMITGRTRFGWLALLACMALVAAGCGGDDNEDAAADEPGAGTVPAAPVEDDADTGGDGLAAIEEAALAEGSLVLYMSQGTDVVDATIAAFQEDYPDIQVEAIRLASGPLANRFASEAEAGVHEADVLNIAAPNLLVERPELFQELDEELIPALADWPDEFFKGHYVETGVSTHVVVYNSNEVDESELPDSWDDLLSDEWRGRAIVLDPRATPTYMSFFNLMAEEYGEEFLSQFAQQGFTWAESGGSASQQVAAGAYDLAFPVVLAHNADLRADGAPLAIHEISPVHGYPHLFAMPTEQPNPNAARLWMHWLLSPEGQAANCAGVYAPVLPGAPDCPPLSEDYVPGIFDLDAERQASILEQLQLQ